MASTESGIGTIGTRNSFMSVFGTMDTSSHRRSSKKRKTRKVYKRKTTRSRNRNYKQKKPRTAGKRKDTSKRRIRYTKNNQPYVILASGKARFISKRSVSSSRKRKGGKY